MAQLDRDAVVGQRRQQVREVVARRRRVLEARRKLREQRAQLARRRQRLDAAAELVEVGLGRLGEGFDDSWIAWCPEAGGEGVRDSLPEHLRVREFLIQLDRELEAGRRPLGPAAADLCPRLAVEGRVHLDRVEVLGVEAQLVEPLRTLREPADRRCRSRCPRPDG